MKVHEVMTAEVETVPADANLSAAAMVMWRKDCGAVPVTEGRSNRVVGMITDRDICMAVATKHCAPETVRVAEVMHRNPQTVGPDDELEAALDRFATNQVRRLPVVGPMGEVVGVLSLNDVILRCDTTRTDTARVRKPATLNDGVLHTLKAVSEHRHEPAAYAHQ
jgi:CBS domain-containing protein